MHDVSLFVSGIPIKGNLYMPENIGPMNLAVLFIHGWNSKQDSFFGYASTLASKGYICMTFDMRGHGISEGDISTLTRADFLNDVLAAFDFLSHVHGVDQKNITVIGSSFGAYLATLLSSKRTCAAIGLRVPANYPDKGFDTIPHHNRAKSYYIDMVDSDEVKWKTTIHTYEETVSLRAIHEFSGKILLVESEMDDLVPHEVVQSYANAVSDKDKLTYVVMKGAGHGIGKDELRKKEFENILVSWMGSQ